MTYCDGPRACGRLVCTCVAGPVMGVELRRPISITGDTWPEPQVLLKPSCSESRGLRDSLQDWCGKLSPGPLPLAQPLIFTFGACLQNPLPCCYWVATINVPWFLRNPPMSPSLFVVACEPVITHIYCILHIQYCTRTLMTFCDLSLWYTLLWLLTSFSL